MTGQRSSRSTRQAKPAARARAGSSAAVGEPAGTGRRSRLRQAVSERAASAPFHTAHQAQDPPVRGLRLVQRQRADPLRRGVLESQDVQGPRSEGLPPPRLELPGEEGDARRRALDQTIPRRLVETLRAPGREALYPHVSAPSIPLPDGET